MYDELHNKAQSSASTFEKSLQYLIDAQNEQRAADEQAASQRYQNLVDQINAQRSPLLEQYGLDSQGAYVNKMLTGRKVEDQMARLGLNTQGFGISQQMDVENTYGQVLNDLMTQKNRGLQDIENQLTGAHGENLARQSELAAAYTGRLAELNKYILEAVENKYKSTYEQLFQDKQYKDAQEQLKKDNAFRQKQLAASSRVSYSGGGGGGSSASFGESSLFDSTGRYVGPPTPNNPYGASNANTRKAATQYGTFNNGYQPKGIVGAGKVSASKYTVANFFGTNAKANNGVHIGSQKVWTTSDGRVWYWDGSLDRYVEILRR